MENKILYSKGDELFYHHFQEKYLFSKLTSVFYKEFPRNQETVYLCIGVDRSSGDCFGPMTGTLLKQLRVPNVLGTLEEPVHARNLPEIYSHIQDKGKFIVAIDASLGGAKDLGYLKVKKGPLFPGSAMGRDLPAVGDISVILNVNIGGIANYLLLQSASFNIVWKGANTVANSISTAIFMIKKETSGKQINIDMQLR